MSVLQTVRYHVDRELQGVVNWRDIVIVNNTGQMGVFEINTAKGNKYELIARSPSDAPPLGQVVLRIVHDADNKQDVINDLNRDRTWAMIAEFLRARESGESAARAVAAARAAVPEVKQASAPREDRGYSIPSRPLVYFIAQKGEFYRDGWAIVTGETEREGVKVLDLCVFAKNHEHYNVERVAPRSDDLPYHCYVDPLSAPLAVDIAQAQGDAAALVSDERLDRLVAEAVAKLLPDAVKLVMDSIGSTEEPAPTPVAVAAEASHLSGIHPAILGAPAAEAGEGTPADALADLQQRFGGVTQNLAPDETPAT